MAFICDDLAKFRNIILVPLLIKTGLRRWCKIMFLHNLIE